MLWCIPESPGKRVKVNVSAHDPKTKVSVWRGRRFICPEGQRAGNKRQRQAEDERDGEGNKRKGAGVFDLKGPKTASG